MAFEEYQTWNKAILDFAQAKGVINPWFRGFQGAHALHFGRRDQALAALAHQLASRAAHGVHQEVVEVFGHRIEDL